MIRQISNKSECVIEITGEELNQEATNE